MRVSASRLKTAMECGLKFKFHYMDMLPDEPNAKTVFGSIIHDCLEWGELRRDRDLHDTATRDATKERFKELWDDPGILGLRIFRWPKFTSFDSLRARGLQIIDEYFERTRWDDRDLLATEHKFLVPFGRHELTGVVDKLELRRSGNGKTLLAVVDYKTASFKPNQGELALNPQFTIYDYASRQPEFWLGNGPEFPPVDNGAWLYETLRDTPRRSIWYHLWGNTELDAGGRDQEEFDRLYTLVEALEKAIELDVFLPNISGESCVICPYANSPCPTRVPTREEVVADENAWL